MPNEAPRVFISYSHDDPPHKQWVANLALKLRANGVDAVLDQWDLFPGEDVPVFMERGLAECDYAILVCTKRYVTKANAGEGGVGYEKMIVTSELIKNIEVSKFIPLIRQDGTHEVPKFLSTKLFIDFSNDEDFEVLFDELLRTIFRAAVSTKPPLGSAPNFDAGHVVSSGSEIELPDDARDIFLRLGREYDTGGRAWFNGKWIAEAGVAGRVAGEQALLLLEARGLMEKDRDGDFVFTSEGKGLLLEWGL